MVTVWVMPVTRVRMIRIKIVSVKSRLFVL